MGIEKALHEAHLRFQRQMGAGDASLRNTVRFSEPSSDTWIEQHRRWRPSGFYRLHCAHDKPMWELCSTCHRATSEARQNFVKLVTGKL